jgi:5-methylthioribose kinase
MDLLPERRTDVESRLRELGWIVDGETLQGLTQAGEGNMNRTLRADLGERTLILKQSVPFVAKYPDIPAPAERIEVEAAFYRAVAQRPPAAQMPELRGFDRAERLLAFEDLGTAADFTDLYRLGPQSGRLPRELPALLAWLAALHDTRLDPDARDAFENRAMRALNHAHIFEIPFAPDNGIDLDAITAGLAELARELRRHHRALDRIEALGARYLAAPGPDDVLLHGDFYPGSWLRHPDGVKIIDPEFAFIGPCEFDLGVLRAHLRFAGAEPSAIDEGLASYGRPVDPALVRSFAAVEVLRRLLGVAQLPLEVALAVKAAWIEGAIAALEDP